jgi:hypothetical protein
MYDELYRDVELPDHQIFSEICFQTKSLPWPGPLSRYRITAAGRLVGEHGRDLEPTGYIGFIGGDDEAPNGLVEYRARFVDDELKCIVRINDPGRSNL